MQIATFECLLGLNYNRTMAAYIRSLGRNISLGKEAFWFYRASPTELDSASDFLMAHKEPFLRKNYTGGWSTKGFEHYD